MFVVRVLVVSMAAALAGCVNVLPEASPAAARYTIAPIEFGSGSAAEPVAWTLAIADPTSTRAYDTAKIALTRAPGQIEYYAAGEWADRSPNLIRTAMVRSFENSGRILGVGDTVVLPGADYVLKTDIRRLHAAYDGGVPAADVALFAKLTDKRGRIIASRLFTQRQTAERDSVPAVGRAFNTVLQSTLIDVVDWSFETVEADQAK